MKALSLTQPWATAVAQRVKGWETRSWPTSYRGLLAIQAAKGFPKDEREFGEELISEGLLHVPNGNFPVGEIICICKLVQCSPTVVIAPRLGPIELRLGDYSEGRFCFKLESVSELATPIPVRGSLGLWNLDAAMQAAIRDSVIWREEFEERAGIFEFMANLPRQQAEIAAAKDIRKLAAQQKEGEL
jgi:activating signal cointegrator 1